MGIRAQTIDMGLAKYTRSVMDIAVNETSGIETGYIEFHHEILLVWRPFKKGKAKESEGVWRPVYRISIRTIPDQRTIRSQRGNVLVGDQEHELPLAELEVAYDLKRYLQGA